MYFAWLWDDKGYQGMGTGAPRIRRLVAGEMTAPVETICKSVVSCRDLDSAATSFYIAPRQHNILMQHNELCIFSCAFFILK